MLTCGQVVTLPEKENISVQQVLLALLCPVTRDLLVCAGHVKASSVVQRGNYFVVIFLLILT